MDKFESQFADLDVQTSYMEDTMQSTTAVSTPQDQIDLLMKQMADEANIELQHELGERALPRPECRREEQGRRGGRQLDPEAEGVEACFVDSIHGRGSTEDGIGGLLDGLVRARWERCGRLLVVRRRYMLQSLTVFLIPQSYLISLCVEMNSPLLRHQFQFLTRFTLDDISTRLAITYSKCILSIEVTSTVHLDFAFREGGRLYLEGMRADNGRDRKEGDYNVCS
jgi:hypothetical protein